MRAFVKYIMKRTYRPMLVKYLSLERIYICRGLELRIPPEVFHPGFFFSTKFMLAYLVQKDLAGKTLLELGAGSGLIAMTAARRKALVTASDINPVAIEYLKINAAANRVLLQIIRSDLFENLPSATFDHIVINPPYYKKHPVSVYDHAWFCGENGEYFQRLFASLKSYMHARTEVSMVLCDGCDMKMIRELAAANGLSMHCRQKKTTMIETSFIYSIHPYL